MVGTGVRREIIFSLAGVHGSVYGTCTTSRKALKWFAPEPFFLKTNLTSLKVNENGYRIHEASSATWLLKLNPFVDDLSDILFSFQLSAFPSYRNISRLHT